MKPCECGCGLPAPIATMNNTKNKHVKGQPMRYRNGHYMKDPRNRRAGEKNPQWRGDAVSLDGDSGSRRARALYKLGPCEHCGRAGRDRHHKDGNTFNNDPGNIAILCRPCHMIEDGRMPRFLGFAKLAQRPGEGNPQAKLADEDVREIRRLARSGMRTTAIAERFVVGYAQVWNIVNGHRWAWLKQ